MRYCWTTLLGTDDFLGEVFCLYCSLKKVNSIYPLVVIAVDSLSEETINQLKESGIDYRIFHDYSFQIEGNYYNCTLNKFHAFNLTDYDKVFFVDADIVFLKNMDFVFEETPFFGHIPYVENAIESWINGAFWLVDPKSKKMSDIVNKYQATYETDEDVLNDIYLEEILNNNNYIIDIEEYTHSFTGRQKIYKRFKINKLDEFQYCIDNDVFFKGWKCFDNYNERDYKYHYIIENSDF